jgi:tape measure domain-containing protein
MAYDLGAATFALRATGVEQTVGAVQRLGESIATNLSPLRALSGLIGGLAAGASIGGLVRLASAAEDIASGFETFLGSAKKAQAFIQDIRKFAVETPLQEGEIKASSRLLLGLGAQADSLIPTMRMLGDVSRGVQRPLNDIAYLYGTLIKQGRVYTIDIRQFATRGIPIVETLAKQFKTTEANVWQMASKGQIAFKDIEAAFKSMTGPGGRFQDMMLKMSKTLSGRWSTFQDALEVGVLLPLGEAIVETFHLKDALALVTDYAVNFSAKFGPTLERIKTLINDNQAAFLGLAKVFGAAVGSLGGLMALGGFIKTIKWAYSGLVSLLKPLEFLAYGAGYAVGMFSKLGGVLRLVFSGSGFLRVVGIIGRALLMAFSPTGIFRMIGAVLRFTRVLAILSNPIGWVVGGIALLVAGLAKFQGMGIGEYLASIGKSIVSTAVGVWEWIKGSKTLNATLSFFGTLWYTIKEVASAALFQIGRLFNWLWGLISPWFDGLGGSIENAANTADSFVADFIKGCERLVEVAGVLAINFPLAWEIISAEGGIMLFNLWVGVKNWVRQAIAQVGVFCANFRDYTAVMLRIWGLWAGNAWATVKGWTVNVGLIFVNMFKSISAELNYWASYFTGILASVFMQVKNTVVAIMSIIAGMSWKDWMNPAAIGRSLKKIKKVLSNPLDMRKASRDAAQAAQAGYEEEMKGIQKIEWDPTKQPGYTEISTDRAILQLMEQIRNRRAETLTLDEKINRQNDAHLQNLYKRLDALVATAKQERLAAQQRAADEKALADPKRRWRIKPAQAFEPASRTASEMEKFLLRKGAAPEVANRQAVMLAAMGQLMGGGRGVGQWPATRRQGGKPLAPPRPLLPPTGAPPRPLLPPTGAPQGAAMEEPQRPTGKAAGPQLQGPPGLTKEYRALSFKDQLRARRLFAGGGAATQQALYARYGAGIATPGLEPTKAPTVFSAQAAHTAAIRQGMDRRKAGWSLKTDAARLENQVLGAGSLASRMYVARKVAERAAGQSQVVRYGAARPTEQGKGPPKGPLLTFQQWLAKQPEGFGKAAAAADSFKDPLTRVYLEMQRLVQLGTPLDQVAATWDQFSAVAYAAGVPVNRLSTYMRDTLKDGKMTFGELNRMERMSIPITEAFAAKLGKSTEEVEKMAKTAEGQKTLAAELPATIAAMSDVKSPVYKAVLEKRGFLAGRFGDEAMKLIGPGGDLKTEETDREKKAREHREQRQQITSERAARVATRAASRRAGRHRAGPYQAGFTLPSISDAQTTTTLGDFGAKVHYSEKKRPEEKMLDIQTRMGGDMSDIRKSLSNQNGLPVQVKNDIPAKVGAG